MEEKFKELLKENLEIRNELASILKDLAPRTQRRFFKIVAELINNEIEQERFCFQ